MMTNVFECLLCARNLWTSLNTTNLIGGTLSEKQSHNPHWRMRKLRTREVKNLPKLTELIRSRMGPWTRVCLTPALASLNRTLEAGCRGSKQTSVGTSRGWGVWSPLSQLHGPWHSSMPSLNSVSTSIKVGSDRTAPRGRGEDEMR